MAVAVSASGSVSNSFGLVLNILKLFQLEVLLNTKTTWPCLPQLFKYSFLFYYSTLMHSVIYYYKITQKLSFLEFVLKDCVPLQS